MIKSLNADFPFLSTRKFCILSSLSIQQAPFVFAEGRFDHWFLSTFKCYNTEERLYTTVFDGGRTVHISDMLKVANYNTVDQLFNTAGRIQKLHLSTDEIILLKAIAFLSRGKNKKFSFCSLMFAKRSQWQIACGVKQLTRSAMETCLANQIPRLPRQTFNVCYEGPLQTYPFRFPHTVRYNSGGIW